MTRILMNEIVPNSLENLVMWQSGDIVISDTLLPTHLWHIPIIAYIRGDNRIPYMLDNHASGIGITITPLDWPTTVIGRYTKRAQ